MIKQARGGGGNAVSDSSVIIRRTSAIGDAIGASVVADKLSEKGLTVVFQCHPDIHPLLKRHRGIDIVTRPEGFCHVNLDGAYETDPNRKRLHFSEMFIRKATEQLLARGIHLGKATNCTPSLFVSENERALAKQALAKHERPWIFVCPRSHHYAVRTVPDSVWIETAKLLPGTKFWMGLHPAPAGFHDLSVRHLNLLASLMTAADVMVTADTGPMHIAAALGVPMVVLGQSNSPDLRLSDQRDFVTVWPDGLDCLNCQLNLCPKNAHMPPCQNFNPEKVAAAVKGKLDSIYGDKVTAVISIYQPETRVLNRCLECVIPQVDEVLVTRDNAGKLPQNALQHPKVKYLVKQAHDIGYGRKQNFCARHANGKWLLLLNDDLFLDPEAVQRMRDVATDKVGMVANLLRHENGRIQHAGKVRAPGERGWGHIDFGKYHPTFKEPVELENVCGACVLVRREAHFKIQGFDENFYQFAEDDDYAMKLRREGWKIMFTPHSTGLHLEHQSVFKDPNWRKTMERSNAYFGSKWGSYLDHNRDRVPLGNFDYLNQ